MTERFDLLKENDKQLFIGDPIALEVPLYDQNGDPLTIPTGGGGWTFEYFVRRGKSSDDALITKGGTITIISTVNGPDTGVRIPLLEDDTKILEPDRYYHTLRRANPGFRTSLFIGDVDFEYTAARTP